MKSNQIIVVAAACVITVALRFVQLPITNFGSMLALSLLCGFAIRRPWACIVPVAIRLLTDIGLQMQTGYGFFPNWYFDYAAYSFVALLGRQIPEWNVLKKASHVVAGVALLSLLGFGGAWMLNSGLTVEQLKIVRPVAQFSAAILLCYVTVMAIGHDQLKRVFAATAGSIAIYFLVSNFGSWVYAPQAYERSLAGLMNCYVMGIPFVRATVLGNLLLAPVFFGAWHLATRTELVPENVAAE